MEDSWTVLGLFLDHSWRFFWKSVWRYLGKFLERGLEPDWEPSKNPNRLGVLGTFPLNCVSDLITLVLRNGVAMPLFSPSGRGVWSSSRTSSPPPGMFRRADEIDAPVRSLTLVIFFCAAPRSTGRPRQNSKNPPLVYWKKSATCYLYADRRSRVPGNVHFFTKLRSTRCRRSKRRRHESKPTIVDS